MEKYSDQNIPIIYEDVTREKSPDGRVRLFNPHLKELPYDMLYHLALDTRSNNFEEMFGDVKFVCMGGTVERMRDFAMYVAKELNIDGPLVDLAKNSHRYAMYKVGPVISVSHGMGMSSMSILIHEIIKLLYYAKCTNVTLFRIGTCGGINVPPGTVVITNRACDELLRDYYELHILGKIIRRPAEFDPDLVEELKRTAEMQNNSFKTVVGTTMSAMDFYETQSRLDGAFCNYNNQDKQEHLNKISEFGVVNIEMEALMFGSMLKMSGLSGAIVCVTLVDRLNDDQVTNSKDELLQWQQRPQKLVLDFIKRKLGIVNNGRL